MLPIMNPPTMRPIQRSERDCEGRFLFKTRENSLHSRLFKNKIAKKKATPISKEVSDRIGAVLRHVRRNMAASNRSFINDLGKVINEQRVSRKLAFRKMVLALPTLEDKLNEIEDRYNRYYLLEQISARDLDGVAYWPPVGDVERRKFLSILTVRVNEYIQTNDDKGCHETISLPGEYVALLKYCDAVQDPDLRSIGVGGLHGSWCVWPQGDKAACLVPLNASVEGTIALCTQNGEPPSAWEFKTAFMIDRTPLMYCIYGYTRYRKNYIHPPNSPFPERKTTRKDYEWKWRIFYEGSSQKENSKVFDSLPEYLNWLAGWYKREVDGDLSFAAAQVNKPDFMLGDFSDTESVGTVDTEIIDDDGSDTEPFTDDEYDNEKDGD